MWQVGTLGLGIFYIIFRLCRNKDNETVRQLRWLRPKRQRPTALTAETTADTRPRNGLIVLMVPMVLKNKDTKTIKTVAAKAPAAETTADTRPRNVLLS